MCDIGEFLQDNPRCADLYLAVEARPRKSHNVPGERDPFEPLALPHARSQFESHRAMVLRYGAERHRHVRRNAYTMRPSASTPR